MRTEAMLDLVLDETRLVTSAASTETAAQARVEAAKTPQSGKKLRQRGKQLQRRRACSQLRQAVGQSRRRKPRHICRKRAQEREQNGRCQLPPSHIPLSADGDDELFHARLGVHAEENGSDNESARTSFAVSETASARP